MRGVTRLRLGCELSPRAEATLRGAWVTMSPLTILGTQSTAGRWHLLLTWVLAIAPLGLFFFNLSPRTDYQWLWQSLATISWSFSGAVLISALGLTYRDVSIWKRILGWMAFGLSLLIAWGGVDFEGI
jgi:hypothetical protein